MAAFAPARRKLPDHFLPFLRVPGAPTRSALPKADRQVWGEEADRLKSTTCGHFAALPVYLKPDAALLREEGCGLSDGALTILFSLGAVFFLWIMVRGFRSGIMDAPTKGLSLSAERKSQPILFWTIAIGNAIWVGACLWGSVASGLAWFGTK